jgi:TonB family protein
MSRPDTWRPDSAQPDQRDPVPTEAVEAIQVVSSLPGIGDGAPAKPESDFSELAAKFAAHGGGRIPAELSGELALDIVLNEIVERACVVTGATGAAIALARDGEMVCRASSGGTAPELGTRLDMNSGLSGACLRSRRIQCCEDALADPSADAEVSRQLGVRSVVVLPLLQGQISQDQELIGIFEIFSTLPAAFSDRDLRTLEILAERVLKNTRARQTSLTSVGLAPADLIDGARAADAGEGIKTLAVSGAEEGEGRVNKGLSAQSELETTEDASGAAGRFDWLTTLMAGILVAVILLMGTVFAMRMGWLKASSQIHAPRAATATSTTSAAPAMPASRQANASAGAPAGELMTSGNAQKESSSEAVESRKGNGRVPEGGLRVYENGREVFRMPTPPVAATAERGAEKGAGADSGSQPEGIVEVSSAAAEGSLLRRVEPEYPEQALAQRVQGPVLLEVRIRPDGAVQEVKLVSGPPLLAQAAVAAVRQWRFKPRTVNGRAVEMETRITLKFTLPPN